MNKNEIIKQINDFDFLDELKIISKIITNKSYPIIITEKEENSYSEENMIVIGIPKFLYKNEYDKYDLNLIIKGLIIHESEHLKSSNFNAFFEFGENIYKHYSNKYNEIHANFFKIVALYLNNCLEDGRIELINISKFPNNIKYLKYLNAIHFYENPIQNVAESKKDKLFDLIIGIAYYSSIYRTQQNWEFTYGREIEGTILNELKIDIENARVATSHEDVCKITFNIIQYLEPYINNVFEDIEENEENKEEELENLIDKANELYNKEIGSSCNGSNTTINEYMKYYYNDFKVNKEAIRNQEIQKNNENNNFKKTKDTKSETNSFIKELELKIIDKQINPGEVLEFQNEIFILKKELKLLFKKNKKSTACSSGLLDLNNVWRVKTNDKNLFTKKIINSKLNSCISLLIDCSGSMNGEAISLAHKTCSIIEVVTSEYINLEIAYFNSTITNNHFIIKKFDNNINDISYNYNYKPIAQGRNKDSIHLKYTIDNIIKRKEKNKFIIILSDGLPSAYKSKNEGIKEVSSVVNYGKSKGVNVICIAIGETIEELYKRKEQYQQMYKNLILCQEKDLYISLVKLIKNLIV